MTAPLNLDADRLDRIRSRAIQGYAPTMRDTLNLLAEVERLRAESIPRSALVQWGWCGIHCEHDGRFHSERCHPVYVIREDTDA